MRTATQAAREPATPASDSARREQPDACVPTKLHGGAPRFARPISAAAPARLLADIFEEFVQLHPAPRDRKRGIGLGLSIARRLASLLGHEITVASRIGRGSCFRLRLPFGRQAARCERACASGGHRNRALAGSFVVFIDDDQELREAMAMLLARWGCHAIVAASAGEAIERLATHLRAPDVIICDYRLGDGESGLEAVASVRAALDHPIDAIILSGARTALTDQALARSGIPVLRKPAHPDVIRRHVAQCCRGGNRASGVRDARSLRVES